MDNAYIYFFADNFIGDVMAILKYTTKERDLLARLMRAEAVSEGDLGMLMVGNVEINRTIANYLTFKNIRSITDMICQSPGGFVGKDSPLFFSNPTTAQRNLAIALLMGNIIILQLMIYGFMRQKQEKIVLVLGGNKNYQEDIRIIVFTNLLMVFVHKFIKKITK